MKPRSIVIDLFGDYLRYHGGQARLRDLTALMACFGVAPSTSRVTLTRLRKEGWFVSERAGRSTVYALTEKSWRLLDEGRERIFDRCDGAWNGVWHMVIYSVPETERSLRDALRKELAWLGFGPLGASTWVSPHDRLAKVEQRVTSLPSVRLDVLRCRSKGLPYDRDIAERSWDLGALNDDYCAFLERYRPRLATFHSGRMASVEALVERTQLIHDYRKFPFRDPDLPSALLPARWPGQEAHELFLEARDALRQGAEQQIHDILAEEEPIERAS